MRVFYETIRRAIDATGAAIALAILAPLMVGIAIAVGLVLGRPILFRQRRPGLGGRPFTLLKFRTMQLSRTGEPENDSKRLGTFGRFLRRTSLDELPELWNILRGDMSFVGPRPLLMEYLPRFSARQSRRHEVKPGLTGWAQVNGRNEIGWAARLEMDVWYVENRSLRLDLAIICKTVLLVLTGRGVTAPGEATMSRFTGDDSET